MEKTGALLSRMVLRMRSFARVHLGLLSNSVSVSVTRRDTCVTLRKPSRVGYVCFLMQLALESGQRVGER